MIEHFIDLYLDRNTKKHIIEFKVFYRKETALGNISLPVLKLDEEDLEYLYKKYVKEYKKVKEQEIVDIQNKINSL